MKVNTIRKATNDRQFQNSRRSASTPGLKLVEFKRSPIIARVNIPDIPTISPKELFIIFCMPELISTILVNIIKDITEVIRLSPLIKLTRPLESPRSLVAAEVSMGSELTRIAAKITCGAGKHPCQMQH